MPTETGSSSESCDAHLSTPEREGVDGGERRLNVRIRGAQVPGEAVRRNSDLGGGLIVGAAHATSMATSRFQT